MVEFGVKDFGPIIEGKVSLKPLTIFVGPNNSGKSYLAGLIYAVFHTPRHRMKMKESEAKKIVEWIEQLLKKYKKPRRTRGVDFLTPGKKFFVEDLSVSFEEFPEDIQRICIEGYIRGLTEEVQRCFAEQLSPLVRIGSKDDKFYLSIIQKEPSLHFSLISTNNALEITHLSPITKGEFSIPYFPPFIPFIRAAIFEALFKNFSPSHYLPAARSGILQGYKGIASSIVSRAPLAGIIDFEIPKLSGISADFLSSILRMEAQKQKKLSKLAKFLETEVIKGKVVLEVDKMKPPEIYYDTGLAKIPLHRTSSMVSELAPIVIVLRHFVNPEDLLIIEEPEAHLHPGNQRIMARLIVKLIRAGVKVLITTHSDYLLDQLSNFVCFSRLSEEQRVEKGYDAEDYLSPKEISAYFFDLDYSQGGSFIKELSVDKDGIRHDDFIKVAKALYNEAVRLSKYE